MRKKATRSFLTIFSLLIFFNSSTACPNALTGYTLLGEFNNSKYFISEGTATWQTAQSNAQVNGGHLATITSQAENDFIFNNINEIVFIGLNDAQSEGNFEWDNGEAFSFTKFADTNSETKDYGKMNFWNGNWGLDGQYTSRKYIVEIPCSSGDGIEITSCPNSFTVVAPHGGNYEGFVDWAIPTATTDCATGGLTLTQITGGTPGFISPITPAPDGIFVQYQFTDACGNSESCTFTFQVIPAATEVNCPNDITIEASSPTGAIVNYPNPNILSYCSPEPVQITSGLPSGSEFPIGTTTVELSYFFNGPFPFCSFTQTCNFNVKVNPYDGGGCPDNISGFSALGEFGNSKYFLSNANAQPADAQIIAATNGGYLAVINSQDENNFIQQNINAMSFIGLNDIATEGNLEWVNGESLTFDNIDPCGFCEANSENNDYVIMAPWDGKWSFSSQFNSRPYVIEVPCNNTPTDECSFNTSFSITGTGINSIADFSENISNSTYDIITGDVDNTLGRESIKYSINDETGQLENTTSITRPGANDETGISTYWDFESNILYGVDDISDDLLLLWAKDSQGNFIYSNNLDISDIEFVTPRVKVVHNELIITASSTSTGTFPIIKTDLNGNLIWKNEIPSNNIMPGVGLAVFSESKSGGFYLMQEFPQKLILKISSDGNLEWIGDINDQSGTIIVLGESGDGQRFYIKRLSFIPDNRAYIAAFDVNTGNIIWDFLAGESFAGLNEEYGALIYQAIPTNDGGIVMYYYYWLGPDSANRIYRHDRFDVNGNLVWERDTPDNVTDQLGDKKVHGSDGGFVFVGESLDTLKVVRMTSDGFFEPDCNGGIGNDECSFNTVFSVTDLESDKVSDFYENTSNSTYEVLSEYVDFTTYDRESVKFSLNTETGELENTTSITRPGANDESGINTYWDIESNILYGVDDISDTQLLLWAKDSQGNFIFSTNIDISDIEFVFPYVKVVHNELILTASSTTTNTFPIIKTDLNGNLIWKKEIPSNVMSGIGIVVHSESKSGGFYLLHEFTDKYIVKVSDDGNQEWVGDINTSNPGEFVLVLGESGDGQRFYIKRLSLFPERRGYLAAFDVNTGNINWDYSAGESFADPTGYYEGFIYQAIPANDGGIVAFYQYKSDPNQVDDSHEHIRFDADGNIIWERVTPLSITTQLGDRKVAGSDGGFGVVGEEVDNWRVVRMTSDGYFEPDCNDGGGGCPTSLPGFTSLGEYNGSAYFLSDEVSRPNDAQNTALSNNGYLAVIQSQEENDFIFDQINELVYIGLDDTATEGNPIWVNGASIGFTNFDICSFCEENSSDKDYVMMHNWNGGWSWSSVWNQRKYIVEIPCTPTTTDVNSGIGNTLLAIPTSKSDELRIGTLMPNPAMDFIHISIQSGMDQTTEIQIFDARGVVVTTKQIHLHQGSNTVEILIRDLPAGFYNLFFPKVKGAIQVKRFIKVRD